MSPGGGRRPAAPVRFAFGVRRATDDRLVAVLTGFFFAMDDLRLGFVRVAVRFALALFAGADLTAGPLGWLPARPIALLPAALFVPALLFPTAAFLRALRVIAMTAVYTDRGHRRS
jgi:hypothetical protein